MKNTDVTYEELQKLYNRLNKEAEAAGYHLNPDVKCTKELVKGLLINNKRYGYWACPCRLASGDKAEDLDIICPCDYRDLDIEEYGTCYCGLYVSESVLQDEKGVEPIPERRPAPEERKRTAQRPVTISSLPLPVWRCRVCGYLCAREGPPGICPICKAKKDRFERFL
ncbi:MAG TPA: ferredoxin-thioredoxin reductase catalytic domain-containing protein [Candidatus Bathyarchaeia archaeon]|nr:ferredoxin-thioredoxin reductase catalytic domain-containing protein [Candidatus Bathyarchaeia archaeon]